MQKLGLALFLTTWASAQTLDRLYLLRDLGELQVSPDSATLVFTVSTRDRPRARLMKMPARGGTPVEIAGAPEGASNLRWSPDGRRLAFLARDAVWTLDASTGATTRVCGYERSNAFLSKAGSMLAWSPDGASLAFAGTTEAKPAPRDPYVTTRLQYKTRTELWDGRRTHIYVVPASGGKPRAVTAGNFDEHSIDWAPAREIVFVSNRAADPDVSLNYDIYAADPVSGATRQLTRTPGVEMDPHISLDGQSIAFAATTRPLTTIDSVAEDSHIWTMPITGGSAHEVNPGLDRRCTSPQWTADARVVYTCGDHGKTVIFRGAERLFDREVQAGPVTVARDGALLYGVSDPVTPRAIFRDGKILEPLNQLDFEPIKPRAISLRSFDGVEIQGWLYLPRRVSGKAPLILSIHGGPHGMHSYAFNVPFQYYAARGYATLALNPRGSSGYGQKFSDGCVEDWGGGDYRDLIAGVDYAVKTQPEIDAGRLGVMGGSYGGFMTNWVITQTPRFKAAVASASLSNMVSFYATSLYQDLVHAEFRGFPWEGSNFDLLWKWSPLHYVKNVVTPTLFLHGEQDNDVHITQAEEMYTALRRRGIAAELVRYPREGHGFREPKHQKDSIERALAWMDRWLALENHSPAR
jgi:dipeptidyl aminopeptidase/acylaminoacyl peptidase